MSAAEKESIYVQLREYHLEQLPDKMPTGNMNYLLESFRKLEDKVISMLVGFVNGKIVFDDLSGELKAFLRKVKSTPAGDQSEESTRNLFVSKIERLGKMLGLAEVSNFKLKIPRVAKTVFGQARMK